jgi:DNA-binding transcriptional MerR regulator
MGYYTSQEVADMLRINKITLFRWEKSKKIPRSRRHPINHWRVYTKEDIEKIKKIINKGLK